MQMGESELGGGNWVPVIEENFLLILRFKGIPVLESVYFPLAGVLGYLDVSKVHCETQG